MGISQEKLVNFDASEITKSDRAYFKASAANAAHSLLLEVFRDAECKTNLTRSELARRMGVDRSTITRHLAAPSNIRTETLAELLMCMNHRLLLGSEHTKDSHEAEQHHELWGVATEESQCVPHLTCEVVTPFVDASDNTSNVAYPVQMSDRAYA